MKENLEELYIKYFEYVEKNKKNKEYIAKLKAECKRETDELKKEYKNNLKKIEENYSNQINELKKQLEYSNENKNRLKLKKNIGNYEYLEFNYNQKNVFDYFKTLLEKKTNQELTLVKIISPFTKWEYVSDDDDYYGSSSVDFVLTNVVLMPKAQINKLCQNIKNLNENDYYKLLKKLPNVFVLSDKWEQSYNNTKTKILKNSYLIYNEFKLYINDFDGEQNSGIFSNDLFNKDLEYDKIVLKTIEYQNKKLQLEKIIFNNEILDTELKTIDTELKKVDSKIKQRQEIEEKIANQKQLAEKLSLEISDFDNELSK